MEYLLPHILGKESHIVIIAAQCNLCNKIYLSDLELTTYRSLFVFVHVLQEHVVQCRIGSTLDVLECGIQTFDHVRSAI